jgi:hypothetical protein
MIVLLFLLGGGSAVCPFGVGLGTLPANSSHDDAGLAQSCGLFLLLLLFQIFFLKL